MTETMKTPPAVRLRTPHANETGRDPRGADTPAAFHLRFSSWWPTKRILLWEAFAVFVSVLGLMIPFVLAYEPLFNRDEMRLRAALLDAIRRHGLPAPSYVTREFMQWDFGGLILAHYRDGHFLMRLGKVSTTDEVHGLVGRRTVQLLHVELAYWDYHHRHAPPKAA